MNVRSCFLLVLLDETNLALVDFEQPRALYQKAMDDTAREHLISNLAGHLGGVKTKAIKERQCKQCSSSFHCTTLTGCSQCLYSQLLTKGSLTSLLRRSACRPLSPLLSSLLPRPSGSSSRSNQLEQVF